MNKTLKVIATSLLLMAPIAWADLEITPETVSKMKNVFSSFKQLDLQALDQDNVDSTPLDTTEGSRMMMEKINASPFKAKAIIAVQDNGFESIESFFEFVGRVRSASIAHSFQNNNIPNTDIELDDYVGRLKQQGVPAEVIEEMRGELQNSINTYKEMTEAAETAKPEDVEAIKKYPEVMDVLAEE